MKKYLELFNSEKSILFFYFLLVLFFYFVLSWFKSQTIYLFRWDEAAYIYIYQQIHEFGFIPDTLNFIGGIKNYIYPSLYLTLSSVLSVLDSTDLETSSLVLQIILFFTLYISSLLTYKICYLLSKSKRSAFFAGFFFITSPVISNRLFYLHATFYANFVGISLMLSFIYYFLRFRLNDSKSGLVLSIFFYALTLFTHQLVFMMSSVALALLFLEYFFTKGKIYKKIFYGFLFVVFGVLFNIGYIIRIPISQKILSILGISKYQEFGEEVVNKTGSDGLPLLIPFIILTLCVVSSVIIFFNDKLRRFAFFALFFLFIFTTISINYIGIHLPASFRYDSFYIVAIPILLSIFFTQILGNKYLKISFLAFIIFGFSLNSFTITNGFYNYELNSLKTGLNKLQCHNTVSYFRIAPWIPTLSKSNIYYAHVDIYNAHQDKLDESVEMFSPYNDLNSRLTLIKQKGVDCMVYEKNILIQDGIRVKGWEDWRYKNLYPVSEDHFEDNNLVIFKFET